MHVWLVESSQTMPVNVWRLKASFFFQYAIMHNFRNMGNYSLSPQHNAECKQI
jgi:hypothetical protein